MEKKLPTVEEIWNELTYTQKLAATAVVFKHIVAHIDEGGSYRYLIYDRLGFSPDAYLALYPDGMTISNFIFDATGDE